jgi:broad specificity phosphatase PhoE
MSSLLLVRHGQASFFEEDYDRLSALGETQARRLGQCWERFGLRPDRVFAGPRLRQRRTAELAASAGWPEPLVLEDLDEMRIEPLFREHLPLLAEEHPHLRGLGDALLAAGGDEERARRFARLFEAVVMLWIRGDLAAEGVEAWSDFRARVRRAAGELCASGRGLRVAAFTSAGVISAALQLALGVNDETAISLAWRVRNTSVSELLFSGERLSLSSFNEVPHLDEAALITLR